MNVVVLTSDNNTNSNAQKQEIRTLVRDKSALFFYHWGFRKLYLAYRHTGRFHDSSKLPIDSDLRQNNSKNGYFAKVLKVKRSMS